MLINIVRLITGCGNDAQGNKKAPKMALLAQVLAAHEDEVSDRTYTEELLDRLFRILLDYRFDLRKVFNQKYGEDQNTIMHLAVDTGNRKIVECLVDWYRKQGSRDLPHDLMLMKVCNNVNGLGETPLSRAAAVIYNPLSKCGKHKYPSKCWACNHEVEMRISRQGIVLYLLGLGVTIESLLHYVIQNDWDFFIKVRESIETRKTNKYTPKDLVNLKDEEKNSLLLYAALYRDYKLAADLVHAKACPKQFNREGISPIFLAITLRDIYMLYCLSKAECIAEDICNINEKNRNGLTALDIVRSPDSCGINPPLEYCYNKNKNKSQRQIFYNPSDKKTNYMIEKLICHYSNSFPRKRKITKDDLYYHSLFAIDPLFNKRKHIDSDSEYDANASIGPRKQLKLALNGEIGYFSTNLPSVMQFSLPPSSSEPIGGG